MNRLNFIHRVFLLLTFAVAPLWAQMDQIQETQAFDQWQKGNEVLNYEDESAISYLTSSISIKPSKHAFYNLANAYYNIGNIEAAFKECRRGLECEFLFDTGHSAEEINQLINQIFELINQEFAPLRIRIVGAKVNSLVRVENIDYRFELPALPDHQRRVLRNIEEGKFLQMTGIGEDGSLYCEIPYFPVFQDSITTRIPSYTLDISPNRRYRFDFNLSNYQDFELDIDWEDEFEAVESIPPNYIKIITPGKYIFNPVFKGDGTQEKIQGVIRNTEISEKDGTEINVYYVPLEADNAQQKINMDMVSSDEKGAESVFGIMAIIGFTATGLFIINWIR